MHVVDLTNRGLTTMELIPNGIDPHSINYDRNCLKHIENLQNYENLQQVGEKLLRTVCVVMAL